MKSWDIAGDPSHFSTPLPDCLRHVSFRRYSQLSLEVVEKRTNVNVFWPPIFSRETTPPFLRQIVSAIYDPPFGIVWLNSVCWSPSAKPGDEMESIIYVGWVKWRSNVKPFVDQSSCRFKMMQETPSSCQRICPIVYILFSFEDIGR